MMPWLSTERTRSMRRSYRRLPAADHATAASLRLSRAMRQPTLPGSLRMRLYLHDRGAGGGFGVGCVMRYLLSTAINTAHKRVADTVDTWWSPLRMGMLAHDADRATALQGVMTLTWEAQAANIPMSGAAPFGASTAFFRWPQAESPRSTPGHAPVSTLRLALRSLISSAA